MQVRGLLSWQGIGGGLMCAGLLAAILALPLLRAWLPAQSAEIPPTAANETGPSRPAVDLLVVPESVIPSLGIKIENVREASRSQPLPALLGTLALHPTR